MLKGDRVGFNIWGLVLFVVIMIPNFIWFAVPAPNDILRGDSATVVLDSIASICQVLMIVSLCIVCSRRTERMRWSLFSKAMCGCCLIYFAAWIGYYMGQTGVLTIVALCLSPPLAFLCMAIDRRNMIAVIPTILFMIFHLLYGVINFIA